jgi:hypothetical protein
MNNSLLIPFLIMKFTNFNSNNDRVAQMVSNILKNV